MTLWQLQIFVAIVETGSFIKAANKLHVSQPSISEQIRHFEEELDSKLLVRSRNKKMFLTEAGKVAKIHSDHILRQSEILRMEVASLTREPAGDIHIGIAGHQLTSMIAPILSQFHKQFPKIRVDIKNGTSPQIIEMLKNGNLDLGIVALPISEKDLRTQILFSEEMVVLVKKTHPYVSKYFISSKDIGQLQLVLYDQNTHTRARLDEFFKRENISPEVVLELSSVETMVMMVDAGFGASIVPASAWKIVPYRGALHPLRIKGKPLTRQVGVAMSSFSRMPRVIDEMVRLFQVRFKKQEAAAV